MQPQLVDLLDSVEAQSSQVAELTGPLSGAALLARPASDAWSVAEHLMHLVLTNRSYVATLDAAVARGRARGMVGSGPYGGGWLADRFIAGLAPPVTRRLKTFKKVVPPARLDPDIVAQAFAAAQADLAASIQGADGVDLGRVKIRSPLFKLLKMSAFQGYRVVVVHNDRHLWHVRRVVQALDDQASA